MIYQNEHIKRPRMSRFSLGVVTLGLAIPCMYYSAMLGVNIWPNSMSLASAPRVSADIFATMLSSISLLGFGGGIFAVLFKQRMTRLNAQALTQLELTHREVLKELEYQKYAFDQHSIVAITDVRGTIIYVNDKFCALSQYSRDELLGQNHRLINSGAHPQEFFRDMFHTIAKGEVWHGECCNRAKYGSLYWMATTIVPNMGSKDGKPFQYVSIRTDITKLKQAEASLRKSNRRLNEAQRIGKLGFLDWDLTSNEIELSDETLQIYGLDPVRNKFNFEEIRKLVHPDDADLAMQCLNEAMEKGAKYDIEHRIVRPAGEVIYVHTSAEIYRDANEKPIYLLGTVQDIGERRQTEEGLRIAAVAFESQESLMITDANTVILRVNQAFIESTGYTSEDIVGRTPSLLKSGRHDKAFYLAMWSTIQSTGKWQGEVWDRRKNGEIYAKLLTISAVYGNSGIVTHYVGSHIDITNRKEAEESIKSLAFYDPLTSLPNRRLLIDRLRQAMASSARSGKDGALLFIDLDNFKTLNDTLGHNMGDLLLQQVAQRLEFCVREGDTVARLGGDEFVLLLEDLSEQHIEAAEQVEAIGEKILDTLNQPYHLAGYEYRSTPSIGISLFSNHEQTQEQLLQQADIAGGVLNFV